MAEKGRSIGHTSKKGGVRTWLRRSFRALLAELVATALLVWLGCAAAVGRGAVPLSHPALAFGFVITANVCAFGEASGAHMNPAVTLGALLCGRLRWPLALGYVLAQLAGATLGYAALLATSPFVRPAGGAVSAPMPGVTPLAAAAVEAASGATLMLTVCGVWGAEPDPAAPLKVGVVVAGLVYATGDVSGASFNPARSFAPALLMGDWTHQWVYWAGPLLGAALGALLYRWVLALPLGRAPRDLSDGDL